MILNCQGRDDSGCFQNSPEKIGTAKNETKIESERLKAGGFFTFIFSILWDK